eukprot:gene30266-35254_t
MQLSFRSFAGLHANAKPSNAPRTCYSKPRINMAHALTPEEEAFYEARLQDRKAQRKAAIQDAKRRAQFDPSSGRGPALEGEDASVPMKGGSPLTPEQEHMRQQLLLRQNQQRATVQKLAADAQVPAQPAPSASPTPAGKASPAPAPAKGPVAPPALAPAKGPVPPATASAKGTVVRPTPRMIEPLSQGGQAVDSGRNDGGAGADMVEGGVEEEDDMDELARVVGQLMSQESGGQIDIPVAEVERETGRSGVQGHTAAARRRRPLATPGSYRPGVASSGKINLSRPGRASASRREDLSDAEEASQMPTPATQPVPRREDTSGTEVVSQTPTPQPPALARSPTSSASSPLSPSFDLPEASAGDDLDWEALEAFESYEKYTDKLEVDDARAKTYAERVARDEERAERDRSASAPQASTSAAAPEALPSGKDSKKGTAIAKEVKAPKMDAVEELEQLVKFFELVEKSEVAKKAAASGPTAAAMANAQLTELEAEIDWSTIERLMLGDELDKQMAGLKDKMVKQAGIDPKMLEEGYEEEEEEENTEGAAMVGEPWNDEVSSMLVSLVLMSHRRYLSAPLFPVDLPENARATAVWKSDIPILVQDDSEELALEYGNKKALEMLGWTFEDVFEKTSLDMIDADPVHQIFSTNDVYDSFEKCTVIPEVRLRGANGKALLAKDVLVYRIDSLDSGAIGQAIIFRGPVVPA